MLRTKGTVRLGREKIIRRPAARRLRLERLEERLNLSNLFGGEGSSWNIGSGVVNLDDAGLGDQSNAFDGAGLISVNGTALTGVPVLQGQTANYPTQAIAGLNVKAEFYIAPSSATARELVSLTNSTAGIIAVTLAFSTNLGSDASTLISATSNGDTVFNTSDRWLVTADTLPGTGSFRPAITTVLAGPGSPTVLPATASISPVDAINATYSFNVPPGITRSLLFFFQMNTSQEAARVDDSLYFDSNPVRGNDLLGGLTAAQLTQVANWDFDLLGPGANVHGGEGATWTFSRTTPAILEGVLADQTDALDDSQVTVNGFFMAAAPTFTGQTVSYAPQSISGLNVTSQFYAAQSSSTLRHVVSLNNPSGSPITVPVQLRTDLGSDATTGIWSTSNGDTTFNAADRWLVTDDGLSGFGPDPAVTTVIAGPGSPAVLPSSASLTTALITANYTITVPASQTRSLMFFYQISTSLDAALIDDNLYYDFPPALESDLLGGLTFEQLAQIVNWDFSSRVQTLPGGEGALWAFAAEPTIGDAVLGLHPDAFDNTGQVAVNGTNLSGLPIIAGQTARYPAQILSGLDVLTEFFAARSSSTIRELVGLSNPTANAISAAVTFHTNLGSDAATTVLATSSGDLIFDATDRWRVTDDNSPGGVRDPAVTTVFAGPGNPAVLPAAVVQGALPDQHTVTYNVTVPAGQTRSLMFFYQLNASANEATLDDSLYFSENPAPGNDLLGGLSSDQLSRVLNWDFAPQDTTVSLTDAFLMEGNSGTTNFVFAATLSSASAGQVTVAYSTFDQTATANAGPYSPSRDYLPTSGTLVFAPGTTRQFITVPVTADLVAEANETFVVALHTPVNVTVLKGLGVGNIVNDDTPRYVALGPDAGLNLPVRIVDIKDPRPDSYKLQVFPYGLFTGGVRVALGDVNNDGTPDLITAPGPGMEPRIKIYNGAAFPVFNTNDRGSYEANDSHLLANFLAYPASMTSGVWVAAANFDGDPDFDLVVGPDRGGGRNVRVLNGLTGTSLGEITAFDATFTGGVRVAAGDIDNDGVADVIVSAGRNNLPRVQVFKTNGTLIAGPLRDFMAYATAFTGGVFVTAGDTNGDTRQDIITGPDLGGGAHVRLFNGVDGSTIRQFFVYPPVFTGGIRVGVMNFNADGRADILTGAGIDGGPHTRSFDGNVAHPVLDAAPLAERFGYVERFFGGIFVAGIPLSAPIVIAPPVVASPFLAPAPLPGKIPSALLAVPPTASIVGKQSMAALADANRPAAIDLRMATLADDRFAAACDEGIVSVAGGHTFIDPAPRADEEFDWLFDVDYLGRQDGEKESFDLSIALAQEYDTLLGPEEDNPFCHPLAR